MEKLERDERLVVVHADDGVIVSRRGVIKKGVRRKRARDAQALCACLFQCRSDERFLFAAKKALLARVGIERRDGDSRLRQAEVLLQGAVGDANGRGNGIGGEQAEDVA